MEDLDYWRLCDEVSVIQAALLIVDADPARCQEYVANWTAEKRPTGYDASLAALTHAILAGRLRATIRRGAWERGWNEDPAGDESVGKDNRGHQIIFKTDPDWSLTTIIVDDLRIWLRGRGIKTGFFFPEETKSAEVGIRLTHQAPTDCGFPSAFLRSG